MLFIGIHCSSSNQLKHIRTCFEPNRNNKLCFDFVVSWNLFCLVKTFLFLETRPQCVYNLPEDPTYLVKLNDFNDNLTIPSISDFKLTSPPGSLIFPHWEGTRNGVDSVNMKYFMSRIIKVLLSWNYKKRRSLRTKREFLGRCSLWGVTTWTINKLTTGKRTVFHIQV